MILDLSCSVFSDETRMTHDQLDGWENGWAYFVDISAANIYNFNNWVKGSCYVLVLLGTDLLAHSGPLKELK